MSDYKMFIYQSEEEHLTDLDSKYIDKIQNDFKDVLSKFKSKRVFDIYFSMDESEDCNARGFRIAEMCDEWFGSELTKEDCMALSNLFDCLVQYYIEKESAND